MNYKEYEVSLWEKGKLLLISGVITSVVAFLFYHSAWAMVLWPGLYVLIKRRACRIWKRKRMEILQEHFMNGLQVLSTSLQAGLSMENAWREVQKETGILYGESSDFYLEISKMNQTVALNMPIERLFWDFANRSGVEDLISFAEIFDYGKRSGGNWKKIIGGTVLRMSERYEARKEIEVMLASKKMEQKVVNIVPLGMLLFLQFSSWDYISVLYHNLFGGLCMTMCLVVYGAAMLLSEKIMEIRV